jgi:predicted phage-related endonuclease
MKLNIYGNMPIITPRDPQVPMEAANKNYVDNTMSTHESDMALHITESQNLLLDNLTVTYQELNTVAGVTGNIQTQINSKVSKSGDTMSGFLVLSGNPTENLHASTKQYVDTQDALKVSKAGDTMTGALTLAGDPTSALHAAPKQYVDATVQTHAGDASLHITSAQNTLLDSLTVSAAEINQLQNVTGNVQTQVDSKVAKAGDTMTGLLTLSGDPVAALGAATKQFVEAQDALKVSKTGDTMTGALKLPGNPVDLLDAAPKQYVDATVLTHAGNDAIHITEGQNALLDALTVTATEVNQLTGIEGNVQDLLDTKVDLAGGTMTGSLVLNADPSVALGAATKQFVEAQDALKVSKAGDTMTGALVLPGDPVANLQAAPKQYVDATVLAHAGNETIHITEGQNALLGALTVTATELNQLGGIEGNVQGLLNTKLDLAGGAMTGDITMDTGKTIFVSKVPVGGTEVVNKTYVDSLIQGQKWEDPVTDINLVGDSLSTPPETPVANDVYIVGAAATGDWLNKEGYATYFNGTNWVFLQDRPVAAGDRFGVSLTTATVATGGLVGKDNLLVTIVSATPGAVTYADEVITAGSTTLVFDPQSSKFGVTYTHTDEGNWVPTNTSVNLTAGDGLSLNGNILNVNYGDGLRLEQDTIEVKLDTNTALEITGDGSVGVKKDGTTITTTSAGIKVSDTVMGDIADRVSKTGTSTVTGDIVIDSTGTLKSNVTPVETNDVVTKGFVESADTNLQEQITTLSGTVSTLNSDPTTKTYVDTQDALKVAKAGDSMTGHLTLNADPTANLHAAPKQYVDNTVAGHAGNADLHLTTAQNEFIDAVTVTSAEVNRLTGVTSNVQPQLDAKVPLAGGTMTGTLVLNADPVDVLHAATKQYVDAQDALKVSKAGDTMTGALTLSGAPSSALHATSKQYVDESITTHTSDSAIHITPAQNDLLDALVVTSTEINQLQGVTGNVQTQVDAKVNRAGDTMTGALALVADPLLSMEASTKQYTDNQDALKVAKAGDSMTGHLTLNADPTAALHAVTKQYSDTNLGSHAADTSIHITASQNTLLDGITVTFGEINHLSGVDENVQLQLDNKLNLTGGTLTGFVTLHANPESNLQAAPKQYVDTQDALKVSKTGDTMTGALVLPGDPTADLQAAPKQYVDSSITTLTTYVNNQDATKVAKAGDSMTGHLTLNADPTAALHAATKAYVDLTDTNRKSYVDAADTALQGQINSVQATVDTLNADPVTKMYVDAQDMTKVTKAGDTMTGYLTLHADPQQSMHAVTKQYVDAVAQGLATRPGVRLATTTNLAATYSNGTFGVNSTLTATANGALIVDGKSVVVNDRILVRLQTNKAENGDYTVQQTGDAVTPFILKRVETVDESHEIPSSFFYVADGDTLEGTGWTLVVDDPITFAIGVDDIVVNQFSGQGNIIAGNGLTLTGNVVDINTANPSRIVVNADNIDLATTGVTPGTYTKVTVDGYGRISGAVNPTTLAGYGIADGQLLNANLTSLSAVTATGILVRDTTNEIVTKAITVNGIGLGVTNGTGANAGNIEITSNATSEPTASTVVSRDVTGNFSANVITASLNGNANTATTLQTSRDFSITGDTVASEVAFNGAGNVVLTTALTETGVVAGTYTKVTVDAKGRITTASNPTLISETSITDVYTKTEVDALVTDLRNQIHELHLYIMSRI